MEYILSKDHKQGVRDLALRVVAELKAGKNVLWLLTGGSTIPACVEAMRLIREQVSDLSRLTVTLTDERYGEVGHADSSWQKLVDHGFDFTSVKAISVLKGKTIEDTARDWEESVGKAFEEADIVIAQFGVGSDLHISGILPGSEAARSDGLVAYYHGPDFERITLTFNAIKRVEAAYVFVFGGSKRGVIDRLKIDSPDPVMIPAGILKHLREAFIYHDQV